MARVEPVVEAHGHHEREVAAQVRELLLAKHHREDHPRVGHLRILERLHPALVVLLSPRRV
jgi:hypothetical protein